ncbi:MAG: ABC transporter permease [Bacteroidales bacterium]
MLNKLFQIEKLKTLNYKAFKTIVILHALLFFLVVTVASSFKVHVQGITIEKLFFFPYVWNTLAWFASWFNLLLGIVAIMLVTNEFQYRTFRKQLIDGLTRNELLTGKLLVFLLLAAYTMLLVFLSGLIFGIIKSPSFSIENFINGFTFLPVLYVQALAYMLLAMLFAFIFRNTAFSILAFILYFFPVEPILRAFMPDSITKFMPVKLISNLTPMPDFVGISLSDAIQFSGQGGEGALAFGLVQKTMPLILSAGITIAYCLLFVYISKLIVQYKNF